MCYSPMEVKQGTMVGKQCSSASAGLCWGPLFLSSSPNINTKHTSMRSHLEISSTGTGVSCKQEEVLRLTILSTFACMGCKFKFYAALELGVGTLASGRYHQRTGVRV